MTDVERIDWQQMDNERVAELLQDRGMPPAVAVDWTLYRGSVGASEMIEAVVNQKARHG